MARLSLMIGVPMELREGSDLDPKSPVIEVGGTRVQIALGQAELLPTDRGFKSEALVVTPRLLNAVPQELLDIVKKLNEE